MEVLVLKFGNTRDWCRKVEDRRLQWVGTSEKDDSSRRKVGTQEEGRSGVNPTLKTLDRWCYTHFSCKGPSSFRLSLPFFIRTQFFPKGQVPFPFWTPPCFSPKGFLLLVLLNPRPPSTPFLSDSDIPSRYDYNSVGPTPVSDSYFFSTLCSRSR